MEKGVLDIGKAGSITEHHHDIETESFLVDMRRDLSSALVAIFADVQYNLRRFQVKHALVSSYGGRCS